MNPTDKTKPAGTKAGEKARKRRPGRRPATEVTEEPAETAAPAADTQEEGREPERSDQEETAKAAEPPQSADEAPPSTEDAEEEDAPLEPQETPESRRSFGVDIAIFAVGALLGGLAALAAYGGLVRSGMLPGIGELTAQFERRIDAVEGEIAALKTRPQDGTEAALTGDLRQVVERLDAAEARLSEIGQPGGEDASPQGGGATEDAVAKLAARIGEVEQAAEASREQLRGLIENMAASGDGQPASAAVAALTERIDAVEQSARAAGEAAAEALRQGIDTRVGAIRDEVAALRADLRALGERVESVAGETPDATNNAALAIAVAGLERAVNSGASFARELDTVEALAGAGEEIAVLKQYAESGVARHDQLAESFEDAASQAMRAGAPPAEGYFDRLMASARRIVRIRPTGEVEGETTGAILARAEARLEAGDLAAALDELAALDPAAAAAMASWIDRARARLEAERLLAALNQQALSGLATSREAGAQ